MQCGETVGKQNTQFVEKIDVIKAENKTVSYLK